MSSTAATIEEALSLAGYGKFHYLLTGCCALILMAAGIQNGINAFFLPAAQCDLDLTSAEIGSLNASFLIGGICSAFLWGLLADLLGRKNVLLFTLLTDWLVTMFASLAQTYFSLLVFRYLNGFLMGAPAILTYQYYGEFQPEHLRNKAVCFIGVFFNLFWLILPGMAWIIIPLPFEYNFVGIWITSWRLYIIVLSIPSLISGLWIIFIPESPKFLMSRGDSKEALFVINKMYTANSGKCVENFSVKLLVDNLSIQKMIQDSDSLKIVGRGKFLRLLKDTTEQMKQLFKPPLLYYTTLTSVIFFCNMFGYLGLGLWIPEILNKFEEYNDVYPNKSVTLCELDFEMSQANNVGTNFASNYTAYKIKRDVSSSCDKHMDESVFINSFIMGACLVTANIVATFFAGQFNRKVLPVILMLISSISAASIYWLNSSLQHLVGGSLFQAAIGVGNVVISGTIVDIFPTSVGAMAICTSVLFGRLGAVVANLVLGFLLDTSCEIPIIIIVIVLLVGTALCFLIPSNNVEGFKDEQPKEMYKSVSDISIISVI